MDLSVEEKAVIERMRAEKAEQLKASFHRRTLDEISPEEKIAAFDRCFEMVNADLTQYETEHYSNEDTPHYLCEFMTEAAFGKEVWAYRKSLGNW